MKNKIIYEVEKDFEGNQVIWKWKTKDNKYSATLSYYTTMGIGGETIKGWGYEYSLQTCGTRLSESKQFKTFKQASDWVEKWFKRKEVLNCEVGR